MEIKDEIENMQKDCIEADIRKHYDKHVEQKPTDMMECGGGIGDWGMNKPEDGSWTIHLILFLTITLLIFGSILFFIYACLL